MLDTKIYKKYRLRSILSHSFQSKFMTVCFKNRLNLGLHFKETRKGFHLDNRKADYVPTQLLHLKIGVLRINHSREYLGETLDRYFDI